MTRGGDRRVDKRPRIVGNLSSDDFERALADVDFGYGPGFELRSESLRLLAHVFDELRSHNAVGETRIVLNVGSEGELPARLMPIQNEWLLFLALGVYICSYS